MTWKLSPPTAIPETIAFIMQARAQMFPWLGNDMPDDLRRFEAVYLEGEGHFIIARAEGRIIGAIGYLPYDHRFAQLDYRNRRTVEVVRLFVEPAWRRAGVAAALFEALAQHARSGGIETLYLHTHPFLPGAIHFWERQGFRIIHREDDPVWQTTHMERLA